MAIAAVFGLAAVAGIAFMIARVNFSPSKKSPILIAAGHKGDETLPPHAFSSADSPELGRAQIRAVLPPSSLTEEEFLTKCLAVAKEYPGHTSFLVRVFDDRSCLRGLLLDRTNALRDKDWSHWLCDMDIDTDTDGALYVSDLRVAVHPVTAEPREDVFVKK